MNARTAVTDAEREDIAQKVDRAWIRYVHERPLAGVPRSLAFDPEVVRYVAGRAVAPLTWGSDESEAECRSYITSMIGAGFREDWRSWYVPLFRYRIGRLSRSELGRFANRAVCDGNSDMLAAIWRVLRAGPVDLTGMDRLHRFLLTYWERPFSTSPDAHALMLYPPDLLTEICKTELKNSAITEANLVKTRQRLGLPPFTKRKIRELPKRRSAS